MTIKWNRESALVVLMAAMILLAMYYFGHQNYVDTVKLEADNLSGIVRVEQSLLDRYPPSEALLEEYIADSQLTETFLPNGDQVNAALVRIEELATAVDVSLLSVARDSFEETVADVPEQFVKNTYSVQVSSASPGNFRSLIDSLMNEERIWNVTSLSYSKDDTGQYSGNFSVSLYFFLGDDASPEEAAVETAETIE